MRKVRLGKYCHPCAVAGLPSDTSPGGGYGKRLPDKGATGFSWRGPKSALGGEDDSVGSVLGYLTRKRDSGRRNYVQLQQLFCECSNKTFYNFGHHYPAITLAHGIKAVIYAHTQLMKNNFINI